MGKLDFSVPLKLEGAIDKFWPVDYKEKWSVLLPSQNILLRLWDPSAALVMAIYVENEPLSAGSLSDYKEQNPPLLASPLPTHVLQLAWERKENALQVSEILKLFVTAA